MMDFGVQSEQPPTSRRRSFVRYLAVPLVVLAVGLTAFRNRRPVSTVYENGEDSTSTELDVDESAFDDDESLRTGHDRVNELDTLSEAAVPTLVPFVSSNQSGASWLLSMLSRTYPQIVCAPAVDNLLDPSWERLSDGAHWTHEAAECSFAVIRDGIQEMAAQLSDQTDVSEPDCLDGTFLSEGSDLSRETLVYLCPWVVALQGTNYTEDDVLKQWMTEYQGSDGAVVWSPSHQCRTCTRHVDAPWRGLTIVSEWLPRWPFDAPWNPVSIQLNSTILSGSKMVYVNRPNLLARFLESWYGTRDTPSVVPKPWIHIDTDAMLAHFTWLEQLDAASLAWVNDHAMDGGAWTVDFDHCRHNVDTCLSHVLEYLDMSPTDLQPRNSTKQKYTSDNARGILDAVINVDEVKEVLNANGFSEFLGESAEPYDELLLLLYETDPTISRTRQHSGIHLEQYSTDGSNEQSQWDVARSRLAQLPSDRLVVLGDSRCEVSFLFSYTAMVDFKKKLLSTGGETITISASRRSVPALSLISPGDLFSPDESRISRVGTSPVLSFDTPCPGEHKADEASDRARVWREFLEHLAATQNLPNDTTAWYLDTGLMAGRAGDLYRVLSLADIGPTEDATAVLTDLLYRNTTRIQIDYTEELFSRYRSSPLDALTQVCTSTNGSIIPALTRDIPGWMPTKALFRQESELEASPISRRFPVWNTSGIVLAPILDHIVRVAHDTGTLAGIDTSFGPEIPYIFDEKGLWTFSSIRSRTDPPVIKWRQIPIEGIMRRGHQLIKDDVNQTKWPAIHKSLQSGGFPFFVFFGDFKGCSYRNFEDASIPVLTNSATVSCDFAFPTPSYQQTFDMRTDRFHALFQDYASKYPPGSKIRKVVWRGTLSGDNPSKVFETVRWRLCAKVHESQSDQFDVGLTTIPDHMKRAEQNISMVGGLASFISPMTDFQKYVAVLDMDGNSWSSRFSTLLCFNSVVIKIEPEFVDAFYYDLVPWTHFVPVRKDLSDLFSTVAFVVDPRNADVIHDIVSAANSWCAARFNPTQLANDMVDVFESYVRKLDQAKPTWSEEWMVRKDELLSEQVVDAV